MSNRPGRKMSRHQQSAGAKRGPAKGVSSSQLAWWIGGGLAVVIAVALAVALVAGGSDGDTDVRQVSFVEKTGSDLPRFGGAAGADDPAVGMAAPAVRGSDFADRRVEITPGDGRGKVIGFFAHWCPHCQAELPRLSSWLTQNSLPEGVDVVAVSTGVDRGAPNHPPSRWFERDGWPEPIIRDDDLNTIGNAFGLSGYPFFVVVDGQGNVLGRASGQVDTNQWVMLLELAASGVGDISDVGGDEVTQLEQQSFAPAAPEVALAGASAGVQRVSPSQADAVIAADPDGLVVLDIRTPEEFDRVRLADAALIDFYEPDFAERVAELDRDVPYVLYCNSGNRTASAAQLMRDLGFAEVYEVDGGIQGWLAAGLPAV